MNDSRSSDASAAPPVETPPPVAPSVEPPAQASPPGKTPAQTSPPAPLPPVTIGLLVVCAVLFIVNLGGGTSGYIGWRPPMDVWNGHVWVLVTSAFVHLALWHVAFNVYWLWIFGRALEPLLGPRWFLGFVLASAWISSAVQLWVSDATGIGFSGVGYALFGFIWIAKLREPELARVLPAQTVMIFLLWAFAGLIATQAGGPSVGNAAHFSGLAFGAAAAHLWTRTSPRALLSTGFTVAMLVALPLAWAPWSPTWTAVKAMRAHTQGDASDAVRWYRLSMARGQDRSWALQNIIGVELKAGHRAEAESALLELKQVDAGAAKEADAWFSR